MILPPGGKNILATMSWTVSSLYMVVILCGLISTISGVKREDFKTCDQISFCKRNRQLAGISSATRYSIIENTATFKKSTFKADILNIADQKNLALEIDFLENDSVRIRVNEKNPIRPRYDEVKHHILVKDPIKKNVDFLSGDSSNQNEYIVSYSDGAYKAQITFKPFSIRFLSNDIPVLTFNERDLFNFEHLRNKPEPEKAPIEPEIPGPVSEDSSDNDLSSEIASEPESDSIFESDGLFEETFKGHTDPKKNGPSSIGIDVSFHDFEHVYGIPQHASKLSLKTTKGEGGYNEPYRMYNLDVFEYEVDNPMALYGSIPFMVAHRKGQSAGMFWLNSAEMWIDVEKNSNGTKKSTDTHWMSESGLVDVFIFLSQDPKQILTQYGDLTGFTALPPAFSLGYHQCRWNYRDDPDVREVDAMFDKLDIPYDVLWLDIEHTDGKRYFTWDKFKFPDPIGLQNNLASRGRKMVAIVDPHIKRDNDYSIFSEATKRGLFVKNPSGDDFEGWCWPGSSSWVDYTMKEARDWWASKFQLDQYQGSTEHLYVWNDMNEPSVFNGPEITMQKDLVHYQGWEHRELHNMFGYLFHRSTAEGLIKRLTPNKRPFVLSRAFFPGTQRVGAIWTGDNAATWEHLEISTPMLLSIGLTGVSFSGADVGGFFGDPEPELLVRWYQAGAFQPFFRGHAHLDTKRREPWSFGEPYTSQIRTAIRNRYALLPYWYTLFFQSSFDGVPAMRAMFLEFPEEESIYGMDDQYMVGSALLVKPVTGPGLESLEVYLPESQVWYDYFSLSSISSGWQNVSTPADSIPVFIRGGSIIPRSNRIRRAASRMQGDPIALLVALDSNGEASGRLYLDDGDTYDYLREGFAYREFIFKDSRLKNYHVNKSNFTVINPLDFEPQLPAVVPSPGLEDVLSTVRVEQIIFLGITQKPSKVICEKCGREVQFTYNQNEQQLIIKNPKLNAVQDWSLAIL